MDNSGKKDIVVFKFPTNGFIPLSVYLSAFGDTDIDAWVGGNGKTFGDFLSLSFSSFIGANGFTACTNDNSGGSNSRTANINCNVAGEYLIVAADKDATNDSFKVKTLNANGAKVPEPSSLLLALAGLIGLRRYIGGRR